MLHPGDAVEMVAELFINRRHSADLSRLHFPHGGKKRITRTVKLGMPQEGLRICLRR